MCTAKASSPGLDAMTDDYDSAMLATGGKLVDRALEAVEHVSLVPVTHLEGLSVFVSARDAAVIHGDLVLGSKRLQLRCRPSAQDSRRGRPLRQAQAPDAHEPRVNFTRASKMPLSTAPLRRRSGVECPGALDR
jgi:hypothetical protein